MLQRTLGCMYLFKLVFYFLAIYPREESGRLYSPWGHKELDTTERLSLHFTSHLVNKPSNNALLLRKNVWWEQSNESTPWPGTTTSQPPFKNQAAQHEVSGRWMGKQTSERNFTPLPLPIICITAWTVPPHPPWKKLSSTELVPGAKRLGTTALKCLFKEKRVKTEDL